MPNWCHNRLKVIGPDADVLAFKAKAIGHPPGDEETKPNPLNFHSLVPVPKEVLEADYNEVGHKWELEHWGCKWGSFHTQLVDEWDGYLEYEFSTAWAPPLAFLRNASGSWPTLLFLLHYEEPAEQFIGIAKAKDNALEDHCIEY